MRIPPRFVKALAPVCLLAAPLASGCANPMTPTEPSPTVQSVIVQGSLGSVPAVTVDENLHVSAREELNAIVGTGRTVEAGATAIISVNTFDGGTGKLVENEATGHPRIVTADADGVGKELAEVIIGAHEGDRKVLLEPVAINQQPSTLVTVIDILPTEALGRELDPPEDMPPVQQVRGGYQAGGMGDVDPPPTLRSSLLVQGDGAQVGERERVLITFTSTHWDTGEVIETSGPLTPVQLDIDDAMAGLRAGLLDQRVGSRMLLVIPPDQASGAETVVMVVDILASYTPPENQGTDIPAAPDPSAGPGQSPNPADPSAQADS